MQSGRKSFKSFLILHDLLTGALANGGTSLVGVGVPLGEGEASGTAAHAGVVLVVDAGEQVDLATGWDSGPVLKVFKSMTAQKSQGNEEERTNHVRMLKLKRIAPTFIGKKLIFTHS